MSITHICPAPLDLIASDIINGFDSSGGATWGGISVGGLAAMGLPPQVAAALGVAITWLTGTVSAANDPSQGGNCKIGSGTASTPTQTLQQALNQLCFALTGMSPMQLAASNGEYTTSTSGSNVGSGTVMGGYSSKTLG